GQVAFPLLCIACWRTNVRTTFVHTQKAQARNAYLRKVVAITDLPGAFTGTLEFADHRLGHEISGGSITLVQPDRIAVAADLLEAGTNGVTADHIGEKGARQPAVNLALGYAIAVITQGVERWIIAVGPV